MATQLNSGGVQFPDATQQTTAAASVGQTHQSIGSYALGLQNQSTYITSGQAVSASVINTVTTGQWRAMGFIKGGTVVGLLDAQNQGRYIASSPDSSGDYRPGLWLRIA